MSKLSYARALNRALAAEMERDPTVFVLGEDKRLLRARRFHFNLILVLSGTNAMHCRGHRTGRKLSRATTR